MFYKNYFKTKDIKYKTIKFSKFEGLESVTDDSVMKLSHSPLTYNFDCSSGALKDGIGVRKLRFKSYPDDTTFKELDDLPTDYHPTSCWLFNYYDNQFSAFRSFLVIRDSNGDVYYNMLHTNATDFTKIDGLNFASEPLVITCNIDEEDTLVFITKNDGIYTWNYPNRINKIENVPALSSICVHNNKLYATTHDDKRSVIYSDNTVLANLNMDILSGGKIDMNDHFGACNKVVSFKGCLYIFRDFNIAKVTDYANRVDYDVSQIHVSNGRIFDKTVCVCGDDIIYLASDGIYRFDGNNAKRLSFKFDKMFEGIDNYNAVAGYSNGCYYLSCKLSYNDNSVVDGEWTYGNNRNNALIKINVETGEIVLFRGYDIVGIYVINDIYRSEVCVLVREVGAIYRLGMLDDSGMYYDKPLTKVWSSPQIDCDYPNRYKLIKELTLESKQDIVVEVETEKGIKVLNIKGKNSPQNIKVNIKCKKFGINLISKSVDNYIATPQVTVGIL